MFPCDMFFVMSDIDFGSYADDNIAYVAADYIEDVIGKWFNPVIQMVFW